MRSIAIFAGGQGSNAVNIIRHFEKSSQVKVAMLCCNNPAAPVVSLAHQHNVPIVVFSKQNFEESFFVEDILQANNIELVVLAGFMWLLPRKLIEAYRNRIINIHPALLPKHGGKGMYGIKVHESVLNSGDDETGITIHHVDEKYDEGKIILQKKMRVTSGMAAVTLQSEVKKMEHEFYPAAIEQVLHQLPAL